MCQFVADSEMIHFISVRWQLLLSTRAHGHLCERERERMGTGFSQFLLFLSLPVFIGTAPNTNTMHKLIRMCAVVCLLHNIVRFRLRWTNNILISFGRLSAFSNRQSSAALVYIFFLNIYIWQQPQNPDLVVLDLIEKVQRSERIAKCTNPVWSVWSRLWQIYFRCAGSCLSMNIEHAVVTMCNWSKLWTIKRRRCAQRHEQKLNTFAKGHGQL